MSFFDPKMEKIEHGSFSINYQILEEEKVMSVKIRKEITKVELEGG